MSILNLVNFILLSLESSGHVYQVSGKLVTFIINLNFDGLHWNLYYIHMFVKAISKFFDESK